MMFNSKVKKINESGDIILDASADELLSDGLALGDAVDVDIGNVSLKSTPVFSGPYCKSLETVLIAKNGKVMISVRHGNAEKQYKIPLESEVKVTLVEPRRYWEKENAYSFEEISPKIKGRSAESLANFRPLFKNGTYFFRSSSPFDNTYGRASFAFLCVLKYHIKTIIDVADSKEDFEVILNNTAFKRRMAFYFFQIHSIGDDSGLYSEEFQKTVCSAIMVIKNNDGPFLIHCRAGKRRSGFICAILQGLAGLSKDEIMSDYMTSYKNNNGVTHEDNPKRYNYLKKDTIEKILIHINGHDLSNLSYTTEQYLLKIGIPLDTINEIREKLINDKSPQ